MKRGRGVSPMANIFEAGSLSTRTLAEKVTKEQLFNVSFGCPVKASFETLPGSLNLVCGTQRQRTLRGTKF